MVSYCPFYDQMQRQIFFPDGRVYLDLSLSFLGKVQKKVKGLDSVKANSCQRSPWEVWLLKHLPNTPREKAMDYTHSSTASQRVCWVSELLAHEGSYGVISQMSRNSGVSRQTLYGWKAKGQRALEQVLAPRKQQEQAAEPFDLDRAVLTLLVEGHASYRGIQACLASLLGKQVSLVLQSHLQGSSRRQEGSLRREQDLQDPRPQALFTPALVPAGYRRPRPKALGQFTPG